MCFWKHLLLVVKHKEICLSKYDGGKEKMTIAIE
jgi:hypothetical protein